MQFSNLYYFGMNSIARSMVEDNYCPKLYSFLLYNMGKINFREEKEKIYMYFKLRRQKL